MRDGPLARSAGTLLVAFMEWNSNMDCSVTSSVPPAMKQRALPCMMVSTPMSRLAAAVAQAPTGVLMGPAAAGFGWVSQRPPSPPAVASRLLLRALIAAIA